MRVCSVALLLFAVICPALVAAQTDISANNQNFQFYGFARVDAVYDDSEANDTQVTFFVPSEDPVFTSGPGHTRRADDPTFTIYPRLTRLGVDFTGPEIEMMGGSQVTAKIEWDFYGFVNTDSNNDIRMRHAYIKIANEHAYLLAGQTDDMVSPLKPSVNEDLYHWNAGNLGDRRPQVRYSHNISVGDDATLTAQVALGLQGSVSAVNTDGDGALNGEESGRPQVQARVAGDFGVCKVGVWYADGEEETDIGIPGAFRKTTQDLRVLGVDVVVPLGENFTLHGEAWQGQNLPDLRGGVAQGVNATTGDEVESRGYWFELAYKMNDGNVVAGYSNDNPHNGDVAGTAGPATGGIARNSVTWVGFQCTKYKPVTMGLELSHWKTTYTNGARQGDLNKLRWYMQYSF